MACAIDEHKNIVYDPWLARILQRDVFRLVADGDWLKMVGDPASVEYRLLQELQSRIVFIYAKVPTTFVSAITLLEMLGFNLVDTNVVFDKPIVPLHEFAGRCTVRFAVPEDKSQVVELARKNFVYSRFHLDKVISDAIANTIKAEWVGNYFIGKRGDEMVVALVDEAVVGFLLLLRGKDGDLIIDLIAVDGNQRRRGVATDMIACAESRLYGYSRILVGTQVANIPSVRLYEKIGFRMRASHYSFHYHNPAVEEK